MQLYCTPCDWAVYRYMQIWEKQLLRQNQRSPVESSFNVLFLDNPKGNRGNADLVKRLYSRV